MSYNNDQFDKEMKYAFWYSILGWVVGLSIFVIIYLIIKNLNFFDNPRTDTFIAFLLGLLGSILTWYLGLVSKNKKEYNQRVHISIKSKAEREEMLQIYKDLKTDLDKKADAKEFLFLTRTLTEYQKNIETRITEIQRSQEFNLASHQEMDNKITAIWQAMVDNPRKEAIKRGTTSIKKR